MTTGTGPRARGRHHDPRLDAALIDAAIEVLSESGYAAFTTTAVARRAGASTASLYRRWPSKQALAGAVARHVALTELGDIDTGSLDGDVRELLTRKQRILDSSAGPALLSLMGQATHDADLRRILHEDVYLALRGRLDALVARAARRGEVPTDLSEAEISVLALVLIGTGLARSVFLERDHTPGREPAPDLGETELRVLLDALRRGGRG
ncbi:TetR/AcrR family transcriptional regulator [Micromonospora auratinigra]|uniref:Transcriptional regulator, TetR family n=1 Tax=Micromonospora auratinigra TaxID=261654 RepID=A0A1A8Z7S5_9ACTN|nr:TetR/AcrR family transcriptional regulator [Micromonospora auratinigra]SBT39838.1 transcriptional regulator, TetR family [Micromonospora auratinigra]